MQIFRRAHFRRIYPHAGGKVKLIRVRRHRIKARGKKPMRMRQLRRYPLRTRVGGSFANVLGFIAKHPTLTESALKGLHAAIGTAALAIPAAVGIRALIKRNN